MHALSRVLEEQDMLIPHSLSRFNGVRVMSDVEAKAFTNKFGMSALGGYNVDMSEIAIHPYVLTEEYARQFQLEVRRRFLSRCGPEYSAVESFIAHELGHHLHKIISLGSLSQIDSFWGIVAKQLGLEPPVSLELWVDNNKIQISRKVSRYGAVSASELLAECWAECSTNDKARDHIKTIGRMMQTLAESIA